MAVQTKLLLELLSENKDTEYGKKYGFADIHSIEEFQARLPITEYDDYAEYIDRMVNNREENLISAEKPTWYNKTSGTVGVPKKIPYTQRTREWFHRYRMKDVLLVTGFHNATPLVEFQYRIDKTVSLMGEKTTELALRVAAERTAKDCGFLLVDSSVYPDTENVQYVYIMEIDRVPQTLTEEQVHAALEKHLAEVNPSYGDKVKNELIHPAKLLFAQPETYVLYKEMMLMRGNAIAQLKPVTVIGNDMQKRFFFTLTEDFEEIKALSAR